MTRVLLLLLSTLASAAGISSPVVDTRSGRLRGRYVQTRDNRTVQAFFGVPFAQPPVSSLRFEPPLPVKPWSHERLAVTQPPPCLQTIDPRGSEDCLYLNIYTPSVKVAHKYPVLVFFFGGSFEVGTADGYTHEYFLDEDVVLVIVQYRLGLLGFLATNDEVVPGNMGFKDQRCALRWLQENVSSFGGDPARVTIVGQSAGAVSVHYLMLFSAHEGLFRAGISQSASALVPWAFRPPVEIQKMVPVLAELSGCPGDSLGLVQCLKQRPGEEILLLYDLLYKGEMYDDMEILASQFLPLIGGVIEPDCVQDPLITGNPWHYNVSLPWLVGANNNEVLFVLIAELADRTDALFLSFNLLFDFYFPLLMFYPNSKADGATVPVELKKFYLKSLPISRSTLKPFADGMTHAEFTYGIYESVLRADRDQTYLYNMEYLGKNQVFPLPPDCRVGASHGDELFFFFPHPGAPFPNKQNYADKDDEMLSRALVKMWTNFATCLDPTPRDTCNLKWNSFSEGQNFLNITQTKMSMNTPFLQEQMSFWRSQPFPFRDDYFETPKCKLETTNNSKKAKSEIYFEDPT